MADCRQCAEFDWCAEHEDCGLFKQKTVTNADRIRAMTDEELAEWIAEYTDCLCGIHKPGCSKTKGTCVSTWLAWLKQEASSDSN